MIFRSVAATCLPLLVCSVAFADIRYTLEQHFRFTSWDSGFGLSGTITTDGSTGVFTSLDFIKDWSMTVKTPYSVDEVALELFTPSNTSIGLSLGESPGLIVTAESITFSSTRLPQPDGELTWATAQNDTVLTFRTGRGGGLYISDSSEPNGYIGVVAQGIGGAAIASGGITVPEPSGAAFLAGLIVSAYGRSRNASRP